MSDPILSNEELRLGKYTRWATYWGFDGETLTTLVRIVGEFDASASALLRLLWDHRSEWSGAERGYLALEALHNMARGERLEVNDWARRMHAGRVSLEFADLPEPVREALHAASPEADWGSAMSIAEGYEVVGKDTAGERLYAYLSAAGALNDIGPERQRRRREPSAIPAQAERVLEADGRTRWAVAREFTREQLRCLLWLAGEAGVRLRPLLDILSRERSQIEAHRRAMTALEVLSDMVLMSRWMPPDEFVRRIDRGRARLEWGDIPQALCAALERAAPGATWSQPQMTPGGYEVAGEVQGRRRFDAQVSLSGAVELSTWVPEAELPATILENLRRRAPSYRIETAYAVGPDLATVRFYAVHAALEPLAGRTLRLKLHYGTDGRCLPDAANE